MAQGSDRFRRQARRARDGGPRVPANIAALCNGYFGHVLEFDDTHDEAVLHAGSAAIPRHLQLLACAAN
jgi:2-methylcitrate dehydratase PrpD